MSEKLQKVLARLGLGSRRGLEELISAGRIEVNGNTAKLGDRIEGPVTVKIDGRVVVTPQSMTPKCRVLMYHKPEGELTTMEDPEDRPTVFDHLPKPDLGRWIYIGRLDINTSGLLLFTTDGELANALMHPKYGVERVYAARIYGEVSDEQIEKLLTGVTLEDGDAHFDRVEFAGGEGRNVWYKCSLKEGRKREVRRLWEAVDTKVSRLIRVRYAGIDLDPALKAGEFRELTVNEINTLRKAANLQELTADELPVKPLEIGGKKGRNKNDSQEHFSPYANARRKPLSKKDRREIGERRFESEVFAKDGSSSRSNRKNGPKSGLKKDRRTGSGSGRSQASSFKKGIPKRSARADR